MNLSPSSPPHPFLYFLVGRESEGRSKETVLLTAQSSVPSVRKFCLFFRCPSRDQRPEDPLQQWSTLKPTTLPPGHCEGHPLGLCSVTFSQAPRRESARLSQVRTDLAGWDEASVGKQVSAPSWASECICDQYLSRFILPGKEVLT